MKRQAQTRNKLKITFKILHNNTYTKPHNFINCDKVDWLPFRAILKPPRQNKSGDFELCVGYMPNVGAMLLVGIWQREKQ